MANALKEIEHAQRLCDRGDITIGEYFDLVKKWEDAEPVKHGRWLRTDAYPHRIYCSECYATFIRNDEFLHLEDIPHNYCPNCGAIMDEQQEVE